MLVGCAWEQEDDEREASFAKLLRGELRVVWMTPMKAASALWASASSHRAHADRALALLRGEAAAIESAKVRIELLGETEHAAVFAGPRSKGIDGRRG